MRNSASGLSVGSVLASTMLDWLAAKGKISSRLSCRATSLFLLRMPCGIRSAVVLATQVHASAAMTRMLPAQRSAGGTVR